MFHRVKSEADYDTPEVQEEIETTEEAEQTLSDTALSLQKQARETAADVTAAADTDEEEEASAAPAQNLYQRAATTPVQSYSTRPASAPAPSYSAPAQSARRDIPEAPAADVGDRRLAIGRGITMSGEIESCDHLYVEGTVEAALKGANQLEIAESGVFYGTVEIQDAIIAGRFEGEIIVHGSLTVESTGIITGAISYKELSVEAGAVIAGRITPISAGQPAAQGRPAAKKKAAPAKQANEGLFASQAAE